MLIYNKGSEKHTLILPSGVQSKRTAKLSENRSFVRWFGMRPQILVVSFAHLSPETSPDSFNSTVKCITSALLRIFRGSVIPRQDTWRCICLISLKQQVSLELTDHHSAKEQYQTQTLKSFCIPKILQHPKSCITS